MSKGSAPRHDPKKYGEGFDQINWGNGDFKLGINPPRPLTNEESEWLEGVEQETLKTLNKK